MKNYVRANTHSRLRTVEPSAAVVASPRARRLVQKIIARVSGRNRGQGISTLRARARLTACAVSILLLLLVCAGSARAQGSPDVVWQGQHTGFLRYTAFSPE